MATTTIYTYTGDGIVNLWTVAFTYLKKSHVKLYIDDVEDTTFTWVTDSSIAATTTPGDGAEVKVQRVTPRSALDTVLPNSGTFRGSDINNQSLQALYVAEEGYDALVNVLQLDPTVNEWDFQSYQSKNIPTPTSDDSAANKAYVDAVAGSATAAAASATAAASSASAAATSASNAASSATSASTSASTATTQASAASSSASAAAASETAAAASETAAAASQSAAASSASTASTAATTASTAATNASNSATAAQTAQTAAELALDTFDDIFLGSKASAPTLDNDGNALAQGALYWNSTSDDLWIYNSGAWEVAAVPMSSGVTKTGTPVDNQVGVWTGDGIIEGTSGLTYDGAALGITGNITVSGTVDGRDVATDGTKLDGIETAADVTDATNVAAAGAIMDGDFGSNGLMSRTGAGTYSVVTDNSSNWNTAYGWGDHAAAGYATSGGAPDVIIEDQKTSGTDGGTFTSGAQRTRDLNTLVRNVGTLASLSSNQFTLPAGTYYIEWFAPGRGVAFHQSFLRNVTDATNVKVGTVMLASAATSAMNHSIGSAVVTIASSKAFEIQHECTSTLATTGFGQAGSMDTEIYTHVRIWDIS